MALITSSLLSFPALASEAYGNPFEGSGFVKDDWQLVCDNTLTCRAAGYADESFWDTPASILLTVSAKTALPITQVQFLPEIPLQSSSLVELWLNDKNYGYLQLDIDDGIYEFNTEQTRQLLRHARLNTAIELRVNQQVWSISDKGMSAILLKLDEAQGRVGTPISLVSKNNPNWQTPKAAKPKSVINKAFTYLDKDNKQLSAAKLAYFQKNINQWVDIDSEQLMGSEGEMGDCELVNPDTEGYQRMLEYGSSMLGWNFIPVDDNYTLASHICWQGAYNAASGYWLINHKKTNQPKLITTAGNNYYNGEIFATHKSRGIGDCWSSESWLWNGKSFVKSGQFTTGLCRGFAGGAWILPTYVSEVIGK